MKAGPALIADLGVQLLGLDEAGATEPLGLVEFRDGRLALGPVLGHVGAFLGLALLRLRPKLAQTRLAGLELRGLFVDNGADLRNDRLDLLADVLEIDVGQIRSWMARSFWSRSAL